MIDLRELRGAIAQLYGEDNVSLRTSLDAVLARVSSLETSDNAKPGQDVHSRMLEFRSGIYDPHGQTVRVQPIGGKNVSVLGRAQGIFGGVSGTSESAPSVAVPFPDDGWTNAVLGRTELLPHVFPILQNATPASVTVQYSFDISGPWTSLSSPIGYTLDIPNRMLTIPPGSPAGSSAFIRWSGAATGTWTVTIATSESAPVALPGYTDRPGQSLRELGEMPGNVAAIAAIRSLMSGAPTVTTQMIDERDRDLLGLPPVYSRLSRTLLVDAERGQAGGQRGQLDRPFGRLVDALAAAQSGDHILLLPGLHDVPGGFVIPTGVSVRGISIKAVTIQALNVTAATTLATMGENTRLEDVNLLLTSSGHYTLTCVKFGGTTTSTAKLRTAVVTVDNSGAGAGTSDVYGVLVDVTGAPGREISAIRACNINVRSTGSGRKRGIYMATNSGTFNVRDVTCRAIGGTDSGGASINIAEGTLNLAGGSFEGDTFDWCQESGTLRVDYSTAVRSNTCGGGFQSQGANAVWFFGTTGGLPSGATRYFFLGTTTNVSSSEIKVRCPYAFILKSITIRALAGPGGTRIDTFTVRKNGVDTAVVVTLTGTATQQISNVTETFQAGDDLSLKVVTATATAINAPQILLEVY